MTIGIVQFSTYSVVNIRFFIGIDEKVLALPSKALETILKQPCDSRKVVHRLKDCLQLDQASLKQPDPETRRLIRWLANKAKQSNRLDVVTQLRETTPAGTTGEFVADIIYVFVIKW